MINLIILSILFMNDNYGDLQHKDPMVRRNAAEIIRRKGDTNAIPNLIDCLNDSNKLVQEECYKTLVELTGQPEFPMNYSEWKKWHHDITASRSPVDIYSRDINKILEQIKSSESKAANTEEKVKRYALYILGGSVILAFAFTIAIIYFTGYISARLKEWRETIKKAEEFLASSDSASDRINFMLTQLEVKTTDAMKLTDSVKRESQEELDRYTGMLQQNLEHHMKGQITRLKQIAESELDYTVKETKKAMDEKLQSLQNTIKSKSDEIQREFEYYINLLRAETASNNRDYDEALRIYRRLSEIKPQERIIWINMGNILTKTNKLDEAIKNYENAVQKLEADTGLHYKLATLYATINDKANLLKQLSLLKAKEPNFQQLLSDKNFSRFAHDPDFRSIVGLS